MSKDSIFHSLVAKLSGKKEEEVVEQEQTTLTLEERIAHLEATNLQLVATNKEQSRIIAENTATNQEVIAYMTSLREENLALANELEEVKKLTASNHNIKLQNDDLAGKTPTTETKQQRTDRLMKEKAQKNNQL